MSSFSKDAAKVASAPIITQILSILLTPIVTRLYSPESFGLFQIFGSISAPLLVFVTMGYAVPIMIAETEVDRINLLFICILLSLIFSTIIGFVFLTGYDVLNNLLNIDQIKIIVWILPLTLLLHGIYISLRYWNLRNGKFQQNAFGEIFKNIGNYFIVLPAGFTGYASANSLIIGRFVGSISTILAQSLGQIKLLSIKLLKNVNYKKVKYLLVRYRRFPIYNTPSEFLSRISSESPVLLFAFFFSSNVIGFYSLSLRVLSLPIKYLGHSVGEVYYQRGALDKTGNVLLLKKLLKIIFLLGLPFFSIVTIIGNDLFGFLFGQLWKEAGIYSQILSLYIFIKLLTSLATYLTNILEKQHYYLIFITLDTLLISAGIVIGGLLNNIIVSLFFIAILSGINNVVFGYYLYFLVGIKINFYWEVIKKSSITIPFLIIAILLKNILSFNSLLILTCCILLLFLNYTLLILIDDNLNELAKKLFLTLKNKIYSYK